MVMLPVLMMMLASLVTGEHDWKHHNDLEVLSCEAAQSKCVHRTGCGKALREYMIGCSDLIYGKTTFCSDYCKRALIALTSTREGEMLNKCKCSDEFCLDQKERIEVCRPDVIRATLNDSVVSCSIATWICGADPSCDTAMNYYSLNCRQMFNGRKCTARCINSIKILQRQEKAAKLKTCYCDGNEQYRWDCKSMKSNMDELCFQKKRRKHHKSKEERRKQKEEEQLERTTEMSNEILPHHSSASSPLWWASMFALPVLLVCHPGYV